MANLWIIYGYGWWFQPTPLKNITVLNWDDAIPNLRKSNKKCSNPPTRYLGGSMTVKIQVNNGRSASRNDLGISRIQSQALLPVTLQ